METNVFTTEWISQIPQYYDTFLMIKPGFTQRSQIILELFSEAGYRVMKQTKKTLSFSEAEVLYIMYRDKPYYAELCTYMSSDFTKGFIMKSPYLRESCVMKETNKWKEYFRQCYAKDEMRNVMHTSDNFINLQREARLYFLGVPDDFCCTNKISQPLQQDW